MEEGGALSEELQVWQEEFKRDKEYAWYLMGLKGCPPDADISMRFLSRVAESYFRCLTSLPELELSREKTEFFRDADTVSRLEAAVPFMIGAEYLDGKWIDRAFDGLHNIFQREIAAYQGTVEMYLAEQSQQLRVPERIFFHLVESNEEEGFPFAFLATYATKNDGEKINHMPLQYALVEYQTEREKLLKHFSALYCLPYKTRLF